MSLSPLLTREYPLPSLYGKNFQECFFPDNSSRDWPFLISFLQDLIKIKEDLKTPSLKTKFLTPLKKLESFFYKRKVISLLAKNIALTCKSGELHKTSLAVRTLANYFFKHSDNIHEQLDWSRNISFLKEILSSPLDIEAKLEKYFLKPRSLTESEIKISRLAQEILLDNKTVFTKNETDLVVSSSSTTVKNVIHRFKISTTPLPDSPVIPVLDPLSNFPLFVIKKELNAKKAFHIMETLGNAYGIQKPPKKLENGEDDTELVYLYCPGGDLYDFRVNLTPKTEAQKYLLLFPILCGIYKCHSKGIAWIDTKGENCLLGSSPVIADVDGAFCLSCLEDPITTTPDLNTFEDSSFIYSSIFINPEESFEKLKKIDIFQMGILLLEFFYEITIATEDKDFQMVNGTVISLPFIHPQKLERLLDSLEKKYPKNNLIKLIQKMTHPKRKERPSIEFVLEEFGHLLKEKNIFLSALDQIKQEGFSFQDTLPENFCFLHNIQENVLEETY